MSSWWHDTYKESGIVPTLFPWKLPVLCKMTTLRWGHHVKNSLTHCWRTVAGHTIRTGPSPRHLRELSEMQSCACRNAIHTCIHNLQTDTHMHSCTTTAHTHLVTLLYSLLTLRPARNAIICIVLPSPISSPIIPPACWLCSSHSHWTPVLWYLLVQ